MTLSNKLTVFRVFLVLPFVVFLSLEGRLYLMGAFFIMAIATLTDYFDGKIARKRGEITDFGKYMDPLADKLFIISALVIFISIESVDVPVWGVILIITRDFVINGVRTLAASRGSILAASKAGKYKTAAQMISILLSLIMLSFGVWIHLIYYLVLIMVIVTVYSGILYLKENFLLLKKAAK